MSELLNENFHIEKTSLFDFHNQMNAKMVSFGGYYLPINYAGGIIAEHIHTRSKASIFDVSHMGQIEINGPFIMEALEKILPISFSKMLPGKVKYTQFINHEGKIIDDLMVHRTDNENSVWLVVNAACKEKDIEHLRASLNKNFDINLRNDLSLIAIQGPKAEESLLKLIPCLLNMDFMSSNWINYKNYKILATRCGYTGEDGFEISVPNKYVTSFTESLLKNPDVKLAGLGARDSLRLEAGLCLYGHDISLKTSPIEAGLKWSLCKDRVSSADFIGGNAIRGEVNKGSIRSLLGFLPKGRAPAREGTLIYDSNDNLIGEVTSGGFSPSLGVPISMGYINTPSLDQKEIFLDVRGKKIPADVVKLPFVPHNYFKKGD
ncbi:glycine cleavage system aminomethyltransferase GcvT [Hyphomicrobiales bacterium]|jgi:aminomethyltransferase|nr:glycine cleavage system aminomethyltransferase GcvT [Hyphomicrobiales bacterium]